MYRSRVHGFLDGRDDFSAVRPNNFLGVWRTLRGPRQAWFGQFPHVVPGELGTFREPEGVGRGRFAANALDWLDAYTRGRAGARRRVARRPVVAVQEGSRGRWSRERRWPPAGARRHAMKLLPGTYRDGPGNKAEAGTGPGGSCNGIQARCNPLARTGQGTWTFSRPLRHATHLAGISRVRVSVDSPAPSVELVAIVYDVSPSGRAVLLTRGAALAHPGQPTRLGLYPQDWQLHRGHRLGVLLAGSDDFYFAPGKTQTTVSVTSGRLSVPLLRRAHRRRLAGGPSQAVIDRTSFGVSVAGRVRRLKPATRRP